MPRPMPSSVRSLFFSAGANHWESVIGRLTSLTLFFFLVKQFLVPQPRFQAMRPVGYMRIVGGPHSEAVIAPRVNVQLRGDARLLERNEALDRSIGQIVIVSPAKHLTLRMIFFSLNSS